jgi:hypothetical protein
VQKTMEFSASMSGLADAAITRVEIRVKVDGAEDSTDGQTHGRVKVVVASSATLDAALIDPASLRFGPGLAGGTRADAHDGNQDEDEPEGSGLAMRFSLADSAIDCDDGIATLVGRTFDGKAIGGLAYIAWPSCRR